MALELILPYLNLFFEIKLFIQGFTKRLKAKTKTSICVFLSEKRLDEYITKTTENLIPETGCKAAFQFLPPTEDKKTAF